MNNKLLCKPTVLHTSESIQNKLNRQPRRLMLFIMVNSAKTILIKRTVSLVTTEQEK